MSDTPRDQGRNPDHTGADDAVEPTTGPPAGAAAAGAVAAGAAGPTTPVSPAPAATGPNPSAPSQAGPSPTGPNPTAPSQAGPNPTAPSQAGPNPTAPSPAGPTPGRATGSGPGATTTKPTGPTTFTVGRSRAARLSSAGPETDARKRRRRRWLIGGIIAGAALLVIALCAGGLALVSAAADVRDDADEAHEVRRLRDTACLELEQRFNRLVPPGATSSPQARAVAVRDENAAARIYVAQVRAGRTPDAWRQLIDARTAYAEALDTQAKSRTPAFFVAPRTADGLAVSDELVDLSPEACAGPIRRLARPDL